MPTNVLQRLGAIEAAVDTVAVEMERLSEGQRYTARLLTEHTAAPNFASPVAASAPVNAAANGGANASSNAESERARAHGVRRDDAIRG